MNQLKGLNMQTIGFKRGDTIRVTDECYSPPRPATRDSMYVAGRIVESISDIKERQRVAAAKKRYANGAKGVATRNVLGTVLRVVDDLVVFENLSSGKTEQALKHNCTAVHLCKWCRRIEVGVEGGTCHRCEA